jgi:CO/xanthine dehydrogenase Mo-binding subunit
LEKGQRLNTVVAQITAEEFGISTEQVKVVYGDTAICPPDHGAISSRSTFFTGNAVMLACRDAKKRIADIATIKLNTSADKLDIRAGKVFVSTEPETSIKIGDLFWAEGIPLKGGEVIGSASFYVPMVPEDPETGQSKRITTYYSYFAHAVEVGVNVKTGEVRVLKLFLAADCGTQINPEMVKVQLESCLQQGIGLSVYEHIVLENGVVLNPNFADYKIPTTMEMPSNKDVGVFIYSAPHPEGPYGAKGVGEGPLTPIAPAISNAVYDAVGIRIYDLPITREKVLKALEEKKTK